MSKELTIRGNYNLAAPSQVAKMAKMLQVHIERNKLSSNIAGKNYTMVEGWQFAGGLLGYIPKITKVEDISKGTEKIWRADAEIIRMKDGMIMGTGSAICSKSEGKKSSFDEYAICSMAQTRAIGKAYRNCIGWVMKMAGYESTPGEEMMKANQEPIQTYQNKAEMAPRTSNIPKNDINTQKSQSNVNSDQYLIKLKDKLFKMGAKTESQALKLLEQKTKLVWKNFSNHGPAAIRGAYMQLLNSK